MRREKQKTKERYVEVYRQYRLGESVKSWGSEIYFTVGIRERRIILLEGLRIHPLVLIRVA
jgi:hypothetical protein